MTAGLVRSDGLGGCQGPYHVESTGSRLITEVKLRRAGLVLAWVTGWEYPVLLAPFQQSRGHYSMVPNADGACCLDGTVACLSVCLSVCLSAGRAVFPPALRTA